MSPQPSPALVKLKEIAQRSLFKNIRQLGDPVNTAFMLTAGDARLRGGFWTRDFSFATRGLLAAGQYDVVRDQLTRTFQAIRKTDGCLPRTFGSSTDGIRRFFILYFGATRPVPRLPLGFTYSGGGDGPLTVDSNALAIVAALDYYDATHDVIWWDLNKEQMIATYRFYESVIRDGLIQQGDYGDWQDGVKRHGPILFSNVILWSAMNRLSKYPEFAITQAQLDNYRTKILDTFKDPTSGILRSTTMGDWSSLEDNLLAIHWGMLKGAEAQSLYDALKRHPLWIRGGIPGYPTYPDYPDSMVGSHDKNMGLRHYHDSLLWSWLVGLSASVARDMGDQAEYTRILETFSKVAERDGTISEIYYSSPPYQRWSTPFNRSEIDFAWGSGVLLEALSP